MNTELKPKSVPWTQVLVRKVNSTQLECVESSATAKRGVYKLMSDDENYLRIQGYMDDIDDTWVDAQLIECTINGKVELRAKLKLDGVW